MQENPVRRGIHETATDLYGPCYLGNIGGTLGGLVRRVGELTFGDCRRIMGYGNYW